jgi:hypothetical protein
MLLAAVSTEPEVSEINRLYDNFFTSTPTVVRTDRCGQFSELY